MPGTLSPYRRPPRTPPGCEDHLTRQQAAALLGFSSEYKIRQLERDGRLRSVRGPMRTAFYPRADVLALKAELSRAPGHDPTGDWTDAELLLLLGRPNREGKTRTALDLVLETRISIERAERVSAFWASAQAAARRAAPPACAHEQETTSGAAPETPGRHSPGGLTEEPVGGPPAQVAVEAKADRPVQNASVVVTAGCGDSPASGRPAEATAGSERRGEERLSRDTLIGQLRDPDPQVRKRAFTLLKEFAGD
jgi:hypothetical protein